MNELPEAVHRLDQQLAYEEYLAVLGRILLTHRISGYRDSDSFHWVLKTPAMVRVVDTAKSSVLHTNGFHVDPYWDVVLLKPHPELVGCTSLWMDGTSYHSGPTELPAYTVVEEPINWTTVALVLAAAVTALGIVILLL